MHSNITLVTRWRFERTPKTLFPSIKDTKKLLLLSIQNSPHCTGQHLQASISNAIGVFDLLILIADEVYWNNLKSETYTPEEETALKAQAIALGSEYIEQNWDYFLAAVAPHINGFCIEDFQTTHRDASIDSKINTLNQLAVQYNLRFKIARWHEWTTACPASETLSPQQATEESIKLAFSKKYADICALFQSEESLHTAIETTATHFATRHAHEGEIDLWKARSRDYLIEEHAALGWIMPRLGYHFLAYPAEITPVFKATRDFFIKHIDSPEANQFCLRVAEPEKLLIWVQIKFKNKKFKSPLDPAAQLKRPFIATSEHKPSEAEHLAEVTNARAMKYALESATQTMNEVQRKVMLLLLAQQDPGEKSDEDMQHGLNVSSTLTMAEMTQFLAEISVLIEQGIGTVEDLSEKMTNIPGYYSPFRLSNTVTEGYDTLRPSPRHLMFSSIPPEKLAEPAAKPSALNPFKSS